MPQHARTSRASVRVHARRLLVLLALLLALAVQPATSDAASGWYHDWTYGITPRPLTDNNYPNLLATDGAGNVYVADNFYHRARKFTSAFDPVLAFGTAQVGQGGVRNPVGVGVSPMDGSVYVSDTNNRKVEKFDATGASILSFGSSGSGNGQFNAPSGIVVKSDGEVWVVDTGNNRVQRFTSAGVYVSQFGTAGAANGQFSGPRGACFASDGTFYVADTGNNRVQRFSAVGVFMNAYGTLGTGNGQFDAPWQVGCDPGGTQFVVADSANNRVQRFNSTFTYVGQFGTFGTATGQFQEVRGVAIDTTGRIWASDYAGSRIQVFSSTGTYQGQAGSDNTSPDHYKNVFGVASNDAGTRVYVSDTNNHRVQYYDGSGNWLGAWGVQGSANGQFQLSYGIDVDAAGNVYVVDQQNHRVQKFTSNGTHLLTIGSVGSGNGQFSYPWAVAVSPVDGSIFVTDQGNSRVQKFSAAGAYVAQVGATGSGNGQFSSPHGISVDAAGDVYVADNGNNRIQRFTAALSYVSQFGTAGAADGQFNGPSGVAVLPDNTIVVVENNNPRLQHFSNAGAFLRKAGSSGIGTGQLGWPRMVTAAADGSIYIADSSNSRAVRWRLAAAGPPNTLFVHDTNAQAGTCGGLFCVNSTDISAAQPHYSWINQYGATVTGQRTRVHTDTLAGVIGLWHFDGSGADSSPSGHDMSPYNGAGYGPGARDFGQAAELGSNRGFSSPYHARYNLTQYTIEAWFKVSGPVSGYPVLIDRSSGVATNRNYGVFVDDVSQNIVFGYSSGGVAQFPLGTPGTPYFDGLWHHVALANDGSTARLYVDGVERASGGVGVPDNPLAGPAVTLSTSPNTMLVDDVRISNVVRPAEEIAGYYRTRLPHFTLLWDSSPGDTPVANGSCTAGSRCGDVVHGTGGASPLGALRGGRFTAQQKQHDGAAWSDWSIGDWFEQTIGRPALGYVGDTSAATGSGNKTNVLALAPRMSWTNNKGRTNGTVNRQRLQVVTTPLDGVVGLWRFNNDGTNVTGGLTMTPLSAPNDASFNGASKAAGWAQSGEFDGDDTALIPPSTVLDLDTFTVESWLQLDAVTGGVGTENIIAAKQTGPTDRNFRMSAWVTGASSAVAWCDNSASGVNLPDLVGTTNIADGQWHHVACVVDSVPPAATKQRSLYVDGELEASATFVGDVDNPVDDVAVGGRETLGMHVDGRLDELRISSVARTAAEIRGYYRTTRPHDVTLWDSDASGTGTVPLGSCADLARCSDITYAGSNLVFDDARYYARARFKASSQSYWTAWSDYDWFETDTPPGPSTFRTHDTNANPGSINPTTIAATAPRFSFVNNAVQGATAQRTQVVTTTLDDVVGLWRLDGTGDDRSATNNDLVLDGGANSPTYQTAATDFGQALRFDGSDGAQAPSHGRYSTDEYTVELWYRMNDINVSTFPNMIARETSLTNRSYSLFWRRTPNRLCLSASVAGVNQESCVAAPPGWVDGSWHHVAATRSAAGTMVLYVDGAQVGTWNWPGVLDKPATPIYVGRAVTAYAASGFSGDIDDVRVSTRARTVAELLGAYRTRRPHDTTMWDSNPGDTGAALPSCSSGSRCADLVYGTGGGQLPLIRSGARYVVRAKVLNEAGSWSAWGSDWFETSTTLTVGVDSPTRSLGTVVAGSDATATTVVTVTTNNASGYQLSAADTDDAWAVQKDASNTIVDWTGTGATPSAWAAGASGGFGISVLGATGGMATRLVKWGSGTNTAETDYVNNLWAGLDFTTPALLHQRTSEYVLPDTVTVAYRANVSGAQQGGTYTGTVTYTAVANP